MNRVTTDTSRLNNIIAASGRNNARFVKTVGFAVEALAKTKAPVDTGALRNSIYTETGGIDNISDGINTGLPNPPKDSVYVGPTVEYALYLELGTGNSNAQPFMIPALREIERQLEANPTLARDILNE